MGKKLTQDKEVREKIYNKCKGKCAYCGCDLHNRMTIDHIIPYRRGANKRELEKYGRGKDCIDNYNPCCQSCNSSKSTFSIEQWKEEIKLKHNRLLRDNSQYRIMNRMGIVSINEDFKFYFENECSNEI